MSALTRLTPENFDIANAYLEYGDVTTVATELQVPQHEVVRLLQTPEIKRYLDAVYLDMGYRNRDKIGKLLDKMIEAKVEEAEESGVYTSKDLLELLTLAHKMRMDEIKLEKDKVNVGTQNNIQVASFGEGNYGKLMDRLLGGPKGPREG
jgi:hypothetical protein